MPLPDTAPADTRVGTLLGRAASRLAAAVDTARLDAELLLAHVLGWRRTRLYVERDHAVGPTAARDYARLVAARAAGCPLAYLTGEAEFWSLPLTITPGVLVPRPETELVVEVALAAQWPAAGGVVADVGTGSGAIACAVAHERPGARVVATDLNAAAVALAGRNAARLGLPGVHAVRARWLTAFAPASFDFVLANPPYIGTDEAPALAPGLRFEPAAALFAGTDGLADLRAVITEARRVLRPGGLLVLEHGHAQGAAVRALCTHAGYHDVTTVRDLAGRARVTRASG